MNEQTSTPEDSYDDVDDSLSFSSVAAESQDADAPAEEAAEPQVDEATGEIAAEPLAEESEDTADADSADAADEPSDAPSEAPAEEAEEEDPVEVLRRQLRVSRASGT